MKTTLSLIAFALAAAAHCTAADAVPAQAPVAAGAKEAVSRADRRYEEMLTRMQAAIEDIAQMYGNPTFLQIFTNDVERASELKERLHAERSAKEMEGEIRELAKKRDAVADDIALKEREAARLSRKLAAQRVALDAVAGAIEQARAAVEDTSK